MADFKTPNLCGANESLNTALSKIDDIKAEIESKLDSAASEAAAAFETAQADIKAGLDELAVDLPEAKPVNLQSEITSLINDIDKTTAEGIVAFNAKVAELKKDFGEAISDKGLDLDELIDEGTKKLGKDISAAATAVGDVVTDITGAVTDTYSSVTDAVSGGISNISSGLGISGVPGNISEALPTTTTATATNLCDFIPNLEIPADAAGTGVTIKEIEDRASNSETLTLSETPKEILEVQGKKTTQSFFTNINYTQNGKIIVPKQAGIYDTLKAKYTVSLITEKPVAAKQADVPAETEEVSVVTKNVTVEEVKESLKTKQQDIETGEIFSKPDETGFVKKADIVKDVEPVVTKSGGTISATTPAKSNVVTTETITTTTGGGYTKTYAAQVTKRKVQSDKGFTTRKRNKFEYFVLKGSINETFWSEGGKKFKGDNKNKKHKIINDISKVTLKYPFDDIKSIIVWDEKLAIDPSATKVKDYYGRISSSGYKKLDFFDSRKSKSSQKKNELSYEFPYTEDQKLVEILDDKSDQPLLEGTRVRVRYVYLEKVDPNFSG
jgi:hypothetical protein